MEYRLMATLTVNGVKVTVDDSFRSLPPDQQEATVNEIAASLGKGGTQKAEPVADGYSGAPSWTQPITAFGRGVADTFSGGFIDELGAGVDYLGSQILPWREPKTLEQARASGLQDDKALAEQNPVSTVAGQVAGGVGLGTQLAKKGLSFAANAPETASLASKVMRGGADGAATGLAYGFGSGEGLQDRAIQAVTDGALGGFVGSAIPAVAGGVSSAYRNIANSRAVKDAAKQAGVRPEVASMVKDVLEADGSLGPQGLANMQRAGSEAMLADAGPNARAVLDTAIQRGGPGSVAARQAIEGRVARGAGDLTSALDETLGQPIGISSAKAAIREGTKDARQAAYDLAYSTPIDYADPKAQLIEKMIKGRVPQSAINAANELMRTEGAASKQILAKVADDGSVVFEQLPDVRQLDYITRGLREVADQADGKGKLGGTTDIGRAYGDLASSIRNTLRRVVPEYGAALDTAADAISEVKAVDFGSKLLSPATKTDDAWRTIKGMTDAEKKAAAQAVRSSIDDQLANVTRSVQDGNMDAREAISGLKKLSSRAARSKLAPLVGSDEADKLLKEIDRVSTSFELRASVAENSKTYARQATDARVRGMTEPGAIRTLAQGEPIKAGKMLVQKVTGQTPEALQARQDAIYGDLADFLTRPADQAIPTYQALQNYGNRISANQVRADALESLLSGPPGPSISYPLGGLLGERLGSR